MIIGVDADGVLTDMQLFNYTYGQLFFNKEIINPSAYSVREIFEVSKFQEIIITASGKETQNSIAHLSSLLHRS